MNSARNISPFAKSGVFRAKGEMKRMHHTSEGEIRKTSHLVGSARNFSTFARNLSTFARNLSPFKIDSSRKAFIHAGFQRVGCLLQRYYKGFYKKRGRASASRGSLWTTGAPSIAPPRGVNNPPRCRAALRAPRRGACGPPAPRGRRPPALFGAGPPCWLFSRLEGARRLAWLASQVPKFPDCQPVAVQG